jgi:hypothetical protein
MANTQYVGGSFAPPLTAEKLREYRTAIERTAPEDLKASLLGLCAMVEEFGKTPASDQPAAPHPAGMGHLQKLDEAEIKRIWDLVPWSWEVDALRLRCASIPADSPLRTPAYHLLWYAKELAEDREPCTCDKL